jgi:hypothetical protein
MQIVTDSAARANLSRIMVQSAQSHEGSDLTMTAIEKDTGVWHGRCSGG